MTTKILKINGEPVKEGDITKVGDVIEMEHNGIPLSVKIGSFENMTEEDIKGFCFCIDKEDMCESAKSDRLCVALQGDNEEEKLADIDPARFDYFETILEDVDENDEKTTGRLVF